MKNTSMVLIGVFVLVIGGFVAYNLMSKDVAMTDTNSVEQTEVMMPEETEVMVQDEAEVMMKDEAEVMMVDEVKSGTYAPFTPELLVDSANSRRVLFFYANWCPTCQPADASFTQDTSQIPADVTLIRVNYNDTETDQEEKDLAKKYGVTYQHTFVQIDAQDNEITKWNGGMIEELLLNVK